MKIGKIVNEIRRIANDIERFSNPVKQVAALRELAIHVERNPPSCDHCEFPDSHTSHPKG